MSYKNLTKEHISALNEISQKLNVPASWIAELIEHESGWIPTKKNPDSSARGLIQFMDETAVGMGFKGSQDLINQFPDIVSQLRNPVYRYLRMWAPFATNAELYLSVFYPKYRKSGYDTLLPESVRKVNRGIDTPAHYVAYQKGKLKEYQAGQIKVEELIEKNSGFVPALSVGDLVPESTKRIQQIVDSVMKKKTLIVPVAIIVLTLYAARKHIYKTRR